MPKWFERLKKSMTESIGESRKGKKTPNDYGNDAAKSKPYTEAADELDKELGSSKKKVFAGGDEYEK